MRKFDTEVYRSGHNGPDSKSGSRASGSWVRIPPYPPVRACNQADYRLFPFFRNGQFRALALFRRENHPFSPTPIDPHRLVKSSRQTASAAPCQGTAQQFVSLLCVETAEAHHGKCANENLSKSKYGSLLKGCRRYALEIFSPQILIVQLRNLEYAYLNDSPWKTDSVFRCTDCFARSNGIRPPAFPSQCRTAPLQSQWQQGWRGRNLACSSADLQSR